MNIPLSTTSTVVLHVILEDHQCMGWQLDGYVRYDRLHVASDDESRRNHIHTNTTIRACPMIQPMSMNRFLDIVNTNCQENHADRGI